MPLKRLNYSEGLLTERGSQMTILALNWKRNGPTGESKKDELVRKSQHIKDGLTHCSALNIKDIRE